MSWSARTWQPPIHRDGPLIVAAAFFLLPVLFFITAWYASYFGGRAPTALVAMVGLLALIGPAAICFRYAARARRRKIIWSALILAGSAMSLWLPAHYFLQQGGPLPVSSHIALPEMARRVWATTLVSLAALAMGMIPVLLYGLVPGQDRPTAGIPPRSAVTLVAGGGALIWAGALFLSLLNPFVPPLIPLGERIPTKVTVIRPPALPSDLEPATWAALLWRLHDGLPPGATDPSREEADSMLLFLPAIVEQEGLAPMLMGRGIIEFIDVGDDPPVLGTRVSTSGMALSEVDDVFETILTAENFVYSTHWSDARFGRVEVQDGNEAAVITIRLNEEGQETLRRFANRRRGSFLTIALDNVAIASFPVAEAVEEDLLIIRRLDPHVANGLVGIMRHGPLQLVPQYELAP